MILSWLSNRANKNIIGIDIGANDVKVFSLDTTKFPNEIIHFAIAPLPTGSMIKDEIKNPEAISHVLKELIKKHKWISKDVAIAIPRSSVIIKNILIDTRLNATERESRAWSEANRYFPDLVGDIYLDFNITGPSKSDPKQLELVLVACRKDQIKPYVDILHNCGLNPKIVDVNCYALERTLTMMIEPEIIAEPVALLNLNFSLSSLIVSQNKELIYAHDHSYDGQRLFTQVLKYLNLDEKNLHAVIDPALITDRAAFDSILKENLSSHLRHSIHFFYSSRPNINIKKILLSGDCSAIPHLAEFIQKETTINTEVAQPFSKLKISTQLDNAQLQQYAPSLVLCCGLALSMAN